MQAAMEGLFRGQFGLPIPPSSYKWIFPSKGFDLAKIDASALAGNFPSLQGLAPAILFALLFGAVRLLLHHTCFEPLAVAAMKLGPIVNEANNDNTRAIKGGGSSGSSSNRLRQRKLVKFVESLWRFIFYLAFCVIGIQTLFLPKPASWILDTTQFWDGWPHEHGLSDAIRFYYQVELGSYLHQLMWTEVNRSDAKEMVLHHLTTILLIGLSYVTNYTRVGVTIMLLHDFADVFLESAKVFNYSSKAKGHEWAKVVCDVLFGIFALTFFVTRLILYPIFVIRSVLFEAPGFFGIDWLGYWLFASLLLVLQGLHIFWFYLIARMLVRLFTTGIEKDERSDDEDEDEDARPANGNGGAGTGSGAGGEGSGERPRSRSKELSSAKISGLSSPSRKKKGE